MTLNSTLSVNAEAAQFILFQRTNLIPKRAGMGRFLSKLGLGKSYKAYVQDYATANSEQIGHAYLADMEREFERIKSFVPTTTRQVLDIGCGIAGLDLFLYEHLKANNPTINLLDKSETEEEIWYKFRDKGAFYNSLELASEFLMQNGVPQDAIVSMDAQHDGAIPLDENSIDFIVSTISWGFHYPVEIYIASVWRILKEGGHLLLDVRKERGGKECLQKHFGENVTVVDDIGKAETVLCVKSMKS